MQLTGKQRRFLRAQGHGLKPLVWIGKNGIAGNVIKQLDEVLTAHELVKVKLLEACPLTVGECAQELSGASHSAVAQTLGRTILLYRSHPDQPVLVLPAGSVSQEEPEPADASE